MLFDEIKTITIYSDEIPDMIIDYLRDDELETDTACQYWKRGVGYIESYTALKREELEKYPEMVQALLALCEEMHDNRSFADTEKTYVNQMIDGIINLHAGCLLC